MKSPTLLKVKQLFEFIELRIECVCVDWNTVIDLSDVLELISYNQFIDYESDMIKFLINNLLFRFGKMPYDQNKHIEILMVLYQLQACLNHIEILKKAVDINLKKLNDINDNMITFDEFDNDGDIEPWDLNW